MKKLVYVFKYLMVGLLAVTFSCTDGFEELNTDPKNPVQTNEQYMFVGILSISGLGGGWFYNHGCPYYYALSQVGTLSNQPADFNLAEAMRGIEEGIWSPYRDFLPNYKYLENMITTKGSGIIGEEIYNNRLAVIKILKARLVFQTTDFHGDIPYSEAGTAFLSDPIYRPIYDTQESIYKSLMDDLNWAIDHLTIGSSAFGAGTDVMFKDDMQEWKNMANALRLKYALRMSNADLNTAKELINRVFSDLNSLPAPATGYDLSNFNIDNITPGVNYGRVDIASVGGDNGNYGFEYYPNVRIGTTIWDMMSDTRNDPTGNQFFDPRAKVFFDSNVDGNYIPLGQGWGSRTLDERSDEVNGYSTDRRDDTKYNTSKAAKYCTVNYNLVKSDVNNYPEIWIGAAEVQFMLAEAYSRNDLGQQDMAKAQQCYEAGIVTSLKFWYDLVYKQTVTNSNRVGWIEKPVKPTAAQFTTFLNNPKVKFDATNALKLIYAQRWVDYFKRPHEAFFLRMEKGNDMVPFQDFELSTSFVELKRMPMQDSEASDNTENWEKYRGGRAGDTHNKATWWMKQ